MTQISVDILPQTAPISDMRNRQGELLEMIADGPVVLISRSKPAAVLVAPAQWDAIARELEYYRHSAQVGGQSDLVKSREDAPRKRSKKAAKDSPHANGTLSESRREVVTQEIDAFAEIVAMAQPLGPADLARNFDLYTERVLTVETAQ